MHMKSSERKTHILDAKAQRFGRLAVTIALLLRGKNKADYASHKDSGDFVVVKHIQDMKFSGKKVNQKSYFRHSGYPGSLRETKLGKLFSQRSGEVLRKAVWGMLPKNKLRSKQINRLRIE